MQNRAALSQFLLPLEIVPFHRRATQIYRELRATLERQGNTIGSMDLLIATQAKSLGLILVTNNVGEFSRISDLALQNWTVE